MSERLRSWLATVGAEDTVEAMAELYPGAAFFAVDKDRNVIFWSEGAEQLLGFRRQEVLGSHCLKGIRCHRCMVGCGISEYGKVKNVPLTLFRADGSPVEVQKTGRAFYDGSGVFAGGVELLVPAPRAAPRPVPVREGAQEFCGMWSATPSMHQVFQLIRNVAETDAAVLVRGESGTGKELVARAIHHESLRRKGPFLAVNCAALSPSLLESELFGHKRGAFTGAIQDRDGLFAQADKGSLFLDEIAELPLPLQAKLLRVVQEKTYTPVGGTRAQKTDVRIIAATHRSLREEVRAGRFREDLMYRLRVVPLFLPPLRERRADIELLLWRFVAAGNERGPRRIDEIAPDAMRALLDYGWPGNVRELKNVVEYAFAVGRGLVLQRSELPPELRAAAPVLRPGAPQVVDPEELPAAPLDEAEAIKHALEVEKGHIGRAAARLGMSRPTFWRHRKRLGV